MNKQEIKNAVANSNANLSAVGIAKELKLETTSENVLAIRYECHEMVESGEMLLYTVGENETEFFGIAE